MKIKQILKKWLINNIGYKIAAVVFAVILWLVIVNIQDPQYTRTISDIPVTIENEDLIAEDEYVYTISSGSTATVSVTGPRSVVSALDTDDFLAVANFEELSITNSVPITITMTGTMSRYESQLTITQKTMSMVISLEDVFTADVDVSVSYGGTAASDLVIDSVSISPSAITVTAPRSVITSLDKALAIVSYADIESALSESDTGKVTLRAAPIVYDTDGNIVEMEGDVSSDCSEVTVSISASYTKTVDISIEASGTPASGYALAGTTLSFSSVTLKGTKSVLDEIDSLELPGSLLSVSGAAGDVTVVINLEEYLPEGTEIHDSNVNLIVIADIVEDENAAADETEETEE